MLPNYCLGIAWATASALMTLPLLSTSAWSPSGERGHHWVVAKGCGEDFQGNVLLQLSIIGAIDLGHASIRQRLQLVIPAVPRHWVVELSG